ncbi:MAG: CehA/McbA family metallohydrolase [candidate division KSB1 bacterium]|nr:CehA/McbA family metallohydrolase [candidate division KSB1 bacterium]
MARQHPASLLTLPPTRFFLFPLLLLTATYFLERPLRRPEPARRVPVTTNALAEYPDLVCDATGTLWIAWQQMQDQEEQIMVRSYRHGAWADSLVLDRAPLACKPRLAAGPDGTLWVSWARAAAGGLALIVTPIVNGRAGPQEIVAGGPSANWQHDRVCDPVGRLWLAWERMRHDTAQVMFSVRENGRWSPPQPVFVAPHRQMRPALAAGRNNEIWCAWDGYLGNYNYDIFLRRLDRASQVWNLTHSATLEQCPAVSVDAGNRLWLAWHSNADDAGQPDLPRWLVLRQWDGKTLRAPAAAMPDRDLTATGTLQSWESPELLANRRGALWLFGRPSQEFSAQIFLGDRWSRRTNFALPGWGGRGEFVRAAEAQDGTIWTVRRDLALIELCAFPALAEAATRPKLQPAPERAVLASPVAAAAAGKWQMSGEARAFLDAPADERLVFGDLHQHSNLSDGMGTVDDCYTRSRDFYKWDFAALTDHEWFVRNRILPSEWEYMARITAGFHTPPDFVTLHAYEWTAARWPNGPGHKNVYFRDEAQPILSLADSSANLTTRLFAQLREAGALAVPHHIGWTGIDWPQHDPQVQALVEIVSVHGAFEYSGNEPITHRGGIPGMFMQDGLARGLRFGVLGASDGHGLIWHHGIGRKRDPWLHGLAGVWIKGGLTRQSLLEALQARRVYATSGVRILLHFSADGHAQGSEYETGRPPRLAVRVVGTAKIRYVYLLRDNQVIHRHGGDFGVGDMVRFEFKDEQAAIGTHWYYVRVVQQDGEMAWSSPIWITRGE